jgi:hypothetical protein
MDSRSCAKHLLVAVHKLGEPGVQHVDLACSRVGVPAVDDLAVHPRGRPGGWHHLLGLVVRRSGLLNDIAAHAQADANRNQATSMYQQQFGTGT